MSKKKKKIKESKVDKLFSQYIRLRDGYRCQIRLHSECRGYVPPPTIRIQCSHFFNRNHRSTRFDEENCDAFCDKCHWIVENDKNGRYYDWKLKQLGESKFSCLRYRHYQVVQYRQQDYQRIIADLKKKLRPLEETDEILGKH